MGDAEEWQLPSWWHPLQSSIASGGCVFQDASSILFLAKTFGVASHILLIPPDGYHPNPNGLGLERFQQNVNYKRSAFCCQRRPVSFDNWAEKEPCYVVKSQFGHHASGQAILHSSELKNGWNASMRNGSNRNYSGTAIPSNENSENFSESSHPIFRPFSMQICTDTVTTTDWLQRCFHKEVSLSTQA